jgi:hypothetical protein
MNGYSYHLGVLGVFGKLCSALPSFTLAKKHPSQKQRNHQMRDNIEGGIITQKAGFSSKEILSASN